MTQFCSSIFLLFLMITFCQPQCTPDCMKIQIENGELDPNKGGADCYCTSDAAPPGCKVKSCRAGETSNLLYTCACEAVNHPFECVALRCSNGTYCSHECVCQEPPPECTEESKNPIRGNPPCTCTQDWWPTGCTLAPCAEGDTDEDTYYCECTKEFAPHFCYNPHCWAPVDDDK